MYEGLLAKALAAKKPAEEKKPTQLVSQPKPEDSKSKEKKKKRPVPDPEFMFQAIGVIRADVTFDENLKASLTIKDKTYRLLCPSGRESVYLALKSEIEHSGNKSQRIAVYPKIKHYPSRDTPPLWGFELIGFQGRREPKGIFAELNDFEFKLHGLWQFIAVCRTPCISVYKNFDYKRGKVMKEGEPVVKVLLAKASHLPIIWRDAPVAPFKFNPKFANPKGKKGKLKKTEKRPLPKFVQVKARFMPQRDCFGFICQLAEPEEHAPRHLRVSKQTKAEALKKKKAKAA